MEKIMKITNREGYPQPFVKVLENPSYDGPKPGSKTISVSTLLDSPYIKRLKALHEDEIEQDVADSIWMILGTAVHSILESGADEGDLTEERLVEIIDGVEISGCFDRYDAARKVIQDWKVTASYTLKNPDRVKKYADQLNIYAYLLRRSGFGVLGIENVFVIRDYFAMQKNAPSAVVTVEQELMSDEDVLSMLLERIYIHKNMSETPCSLEDRWAKPGVRKVMRKGLKRSIKNFPEGTSTEEIDEYIKYTVSQEFNRCEEFYSFDGEILMKKGRKTPMPTNDLDGYVRKDMKFKFEDHTIVDHKGEEFARCGMYCNVNKFCPEYQEHLKQINSGE